MPAALKAFAQQAHMQLLYEYGVVHDIKGNSVTGVLERRAALSKLLQNTGLEAVFISDNAATIRPMRSSTPSSAAPAKHGGEKKKGKTSSSEGFRTARADQASPQASDVPVARGQQQESQALELQEVVVTAEKRVERLQDVPMSVVVVSGDQLTATQATTLQDVVDNVPGLQLISSSPIGNELVIRGISIGAGINSSVATYVDEVPYTSEGPFAYSASIAPDLDTYDLARVEVLRGPQGTLYGANALGGLLKYVTNAPDPSRYSASFLVGGSSVQDGGDGWEAHAMVNVPFGDTTALRIVANSAYFPGFIDEPSRGKTNINDVRRDADRASFLWEPSQDVSVRLTAHYQSLTAGDYSTEDLTAALAPVYGDLTQERAVAQPQQETNEIYNGTINWNLGFASLVSSTSESRLSPSIQIDDTASFAATLDGLFGGNLGAVVQSQTPVHSVTQELRLASPTDQRVEWLLGAYYDSESAVDDEYIYPVELETGQPLYDFTPNLAAYHITSTYREYAGFGDVTYHFNSAFELGAGGRYSTNDQTYHQVNSGLFVGTNNFVTDSNQSVFTYSVDAKYKFDPRTMLYARIASGFVPGGPNDALPGLPLPKTFHSSSTTNYELGIKGNAGRGRASYDVDIFDVEWDDIQLLAAINNAYGLVNGGAARSRGLEGDVSYIPTAGLRVGLSAAYTDARLTQDTPASFGGVAGDELPLSPYVSTTVSAEYRLPLWSNVSGFGGVDWHYEGDRMSEFEFTLPRQTLPAYSMLSLRAGVTFKSYTLTAYVKNALDVRAISSIQTEAVPGVLSAAVATPTTVGVTLAGSF